MTGDSVKNDDALTKQEIFELSCRYMRSLDRLDAELRHTVFHDDATVDYGFFKGPAREFVCTKRVTLSPNMSYWALASPAVLTA